MPTRTLQQLTDEVAERGFQYLSQARRTQFVNDALAELAEAYAWPFLESSYTGNVPVNMGDLAGINYSRSVLSVNDVASHQSIPYIEQALLSKQGVNFADTGTARYWYWQGTTLKTYPMATGTVYIEFLGGAKELTNLSDTVTGPMMFYQLIIDGAVIRCLQDTDNYNEVQAARVDYDRRLGNLVGSYSKRQAEPRFIVSVVSDWNA